MATLKTVKSSGGDYTNLQAAVTAWAAANADWDIECYASVGEDNPVVVPSGETNTLRIYTPSAQRHLGKSGTTGYRIGCEGFAWGIELQSPNVTIEGIQFVDGNDGNPNGAIKLNASVSWNVIVRECLDENTGVFGFISVAAGTAGTVKVANSIKIGGAADPRFIHHDGGSGYTSYVYNCTARSTYTGGFGRFYWQDSVATMVCKNCIGTFVTASTNDCFSGTITQDHNVSSDATASGTGSKTSSTPTYVNTGTGDLHLGSSDTIAKDSGTDLSGDGNFAISIDIDGQTRSGTWDIGADEIVANISVGLGGSALTTNAGTTSPSISVAL